MVLPNYIPTTTEISLITGLTEQYNASGTLQSYETHYYIVPFFVWVVIITPIFFIGARFIKELIKRWS